HIVVIPTGASAMRFGAQNTVLNPDWPRDRPEWPAYEADLKSWLGVDNVVVLHTRDRALADSAAFTMPLRNATGVFLGRAMQDESPMHTWVPVLNTNCRTF